MAGGSHTDFDTGAFSTGAVAGAGLIAGALAQGLVNYRAQQERRWANWNVTALRGALDLSEALRSREQTALRSKNAIIVAQRVTIARLESELVIERARARSLRRK